MSIQRTVSRNPVSGISKAIDMLGSKEAANHACAYRILNTGMIKLTGKEIVQAAKDYQFMLSLGETTEYTMEQAVRVAEIVGVPQSFIERDGGPTEFVSKRYRFFVMSAIAGRPHKEQISMVKSTMDELEFRENGIFLPADKISDFTNIKKAANSSADATTRVIDTSEDGISRMLMEHGINSATLFVGQVSFDETEQNAIDEKKRRLFTEGFINEATGKHYMFSFQSPSSVRKGNFTFVEANSWREVVSLWIEISGLLTKEEIETKTQEELLDILLSKSVGLANEEHEVVIAKLLARLSTRGSNSFSLDRRAETKEQKEALTFVKGINVFYPKKDMKVKITRDYYTFGDEDGVLKLITGKQRTVTPGDGQMLGSYRLHAYIAFILNLISYTDFKRFLKLWEEANEDDRNVEEGSELERLILKIPCIFQIRHGSKKGICVRTNLERVSKYDAIVPPSVRKFVEGEWKNFPLEICNWIKKTPAQPTVMLNNQFISALDIEPENLRKVADYWFDIMNKSLTSETEAMKFHKMIRATDEEDELDEDLSNSMVSHCIWANSKLMLDRQVCNWRKDQYTKIINNMSIGRIGVPGIYSYMVCDPHALVNFYLELKDEDKMEELKAGEYYYCGKDNCTAALFRSPLIHPFEVQKVTLKYLRAFFGIQGAIIFNVHDGKWDAMGGAK